MCMCRRLIALKVITNFVSLILILIFLSLMKRFRSGEGKVEGESISMANVLMLLSKGGCGGRGDDNKDSVKESLPARVFECKTCSRQFTSFQALGGHRASHRKLRMAGDCDGEGRAGLGKPRVHGCPICGLEFTVGQALGGHMRRHRGGAGRCCDDGNEKKAGERRVLCLDLNLAPPDSDAEECRNIDLGIHRVHQLPIVDFFY